jgi:F-box protein 18 (helicase)
MELTEEQQRVVRSRAGRLAVQAGAGAAKTTTLCEYAAARPTQRILYLAYNKSIRLEAQERMPSNVTARTTHSVAWRKAVALFGPRAMDRVGDTYPSSVSRAFGCGALTAAAALKSIARWCAALEPRIDLHHVPPELAARMADPGIVVGVAREVWSAMVQGRLPEIKLPPDGYLKLFQMEAPVLQGFDTILVDEVQDLNLCTFDIVRRQRSGIVMVGDEAQGIYSFRGAMNALAIFEAEERLPLTRSFRFGEGVAAVANALLSAFKPGFHQRLVGAGQPTRTRFTVDTKKGFAVIARTNACIFKEAVSFLALNRRYHFIGGTEGYKLEKILDVYYLSCGDRGLMRDPYLRSFESFDALVSLAEESENPELKHLVRVVAEYGHRLPDLIDEIKSRHVEMNKHAWRQFDGITFSTAHRSKGLEFEQVWLADDYMRFFEDGKEVDPDEVVQEEIHILYVALTRARAALRLSESLEEWLRHKQLMPA